MTERFRFQSRLTLDLIDRHSGQISWAVYWTVDSRLQNVTRNPGGYKGR